MTRRLFVFLNPNGFAVVKALLVDDVTKAKQDVAIEALSSVASDSIIAVLAGEDVSTWLIDLPSLSDGKLIQILPSQLEDMKAITRPDDHYALLQRMNGASRVVGCVSATVMDNAHSALDSAGLVLDIMIPDYALLPAGDGVCVSDAPIGDDRLLVRMKDGTGFAANSTITKEITGPYNQAPLSISGYNDQGLADYNLLQGRYKPRLAFTMYLPYVRRAVWLAGFAIIVWSAGIFISAQKNHQQADIITTETEALFAEAFPEITRIVDMQAQARRLVSQSSLAQGSVFLRISEIVFKAVEVHDGAVVEGLRYNQDQSAFFVTVSVSSFSESDALLSALRSNGLGITEGGSRQDNGRVVTDIAIEVTS